MGKTLAPGTAVTYQTGFGAVKNVLKSNYIYNNNGLDKARVVTSVGTFSKSCG